MLTMFPFPCPFPWRQIRETPHKKHHKFIEFYDVRAAEAALRALNRSDIAGKRIKLEPSRPGGTRRKCVAFHSCTSLGLVTCSNYVPAKLRQIITLPINSWFSIEFMLSYMYAFF